MPEEMSYICFILYYKDDGLHAPILLAKVLEHSYEDGHLTELSQSLPRSSCAGSTASTTPSIPVMENPGDLPTTFRLLRPAACHAVQVVHGRLLVSASQRNRLSA